MAAPSKIQDEQEVIRWFREGRTYRWMCEEYERKYNISMTQSAFSNFRRRRGLDRRITRDDELIPWEVMQEHRWAYPLMMLRFEARRRTGAPISETDERRLDAWLLELKDLHGVVLYDPDTPDGFYIVAREEGDDDIIRRPRTGLTRRHRAD